MKKKFDCVQMKHRIQIEQMKRMKGLTAAEEAEVMRKAILKNPILAQLWRQSKRVRSQADLLENK